MSELGLEVDPELVVVTQAFTEAEGAKACAELLDRGAGPTAIAAANDLIALGCYDVFAERAIPCPDEISVVGFNDMPFADRFQPPLTTIRIPHYEIGMAAAELMLELLLNGGTPPRDIRLEPSLVVRSSAAAPADA
jgi:LacI family transcriptional regulator